MMQTFILWGHRPAYNLKDTDTFGRVHCPQLHSLSISKDVNLLVKSMENVHQLDINYYGGPIHLYLKILDFGLISFL